MMKKCILILILSVVLAGHLHSQLNEMQILLNQARMHENRNQISQALEIYESLYEKHPRDENLVEAIIRVSYLAGNFSKAREYLDKSKGKLSAYFLARQETLYLIKTNNIKDAEKTAMDWLNKNPGSMQHYRDFARIFESATLFDTAIDIYLKGRAVAKDNNLHALELSNNYYYIKNIPRFYEESLNFLRLNSGYLYFYRTRFTETISSNHRNIEILTSLIRENEPEVIYEIYAFSLIEAKDYQKATEIFDLLPIEKVIKFADDLKSDNQLQIALNTYRLALEKATTPIIKSDLQIKMAQIYFELNDIENCKLILNEIINNKEIQVAPIMHRTKANVESRMLMALLSIQQNDDIATTRAWFEAASNFAINMIEKSDILFKLSRYLYLKEDYTQAHNIINQAIRGQDRHSNIYKSSFFYRYEIALFQNSDIRDSLLTECIIHFPQDARITDMLFLETFLNNMSDEYQKAQFLQAMRYKGLYQDSLAISTILEIAETTNIEELLLLAYEWGYISHYEMVKHIEDYNFKNNVLKDFVFLQTIRSAENDDSRRGMISDFLNKNPQNVFSPQLRFILFNSRS